MELISEQIEEIIEKHEKQGYPKVRRWKRIICWVKRRHEFLYQTDVFYAYGTENAVSVHEGLCLRCRKYYREVSPFTI